MGRAGEADDTYVGVDVGATKTAVALGTKYGEVRASTTFPTPLGDPVTLVDSVLEAAHGLEHAGMPPPRAFGVGICAGVDTAGRVHGLDALGWGTEVELGGLIAARTGCPVLVDNDANAGALAEQLWGAGRAVDDFVYLALGTGVGAGLVLGGELHRGARGFAGEIGHVTVDLGGPQCACGNRGCLEATCGGKALAAAITKRLVDDPWVSTSLREPLAAHGAVSARDLFAHAAAGDGFAGEEVAGFAQRVAAAIVNVANLLDVPLFVVGGGLGLNPIVVPAIQRELRSTRPFLDPDGLRVVPAVLGGDAAVLGALVLATRAARGSRAEGAREGGESM